jgi:hypothetical protein
MEAQQKKEHNKKSIDGAESVANTFALVTIFCVGVRSNGPAIDTEYPVHAYPTSLPTN